MEDKSVEEQQIDDVKVATDRLVCPKIELPFNIVLYSKQAEGSDIVSNCFYYCSKKCKIEQVAIKFSSAENREKFDSIIKKMVKQRREKQKMFAFVNPSSGNRRGQCHAHMGENKNHLHIFKAPSLSIYS